MQTRIYNGYTQVKGDRVWQFIVIGFSCDNETATVMRTGNDRVRVPIDDKDRITVDGRKYGKKHWMH